MEKHMVNNRNSSHPQDTPLMDYWHIIRRHKWSIFSITVISTIVGIFFSTTITPTYLASSRLLIQPETQQVLFSDNSPGGRQQTLSFYQTQVEIIRSRSFSTEVISALDLVNHRDYLPEKPNFLQSFLQTNEVGSPVKFKKGDVSDISEIVPLFKLLMKVNLEKNSEIVNINYEGKDAVMTAKVVNKVVDVYIKRMELAQKQSNQETIGWLSDNFEMARKKLVESEAELQTYQSRQQIGDSKDEDSIKSGKYGNITTRLLSAGTKRAELKIRLDQVRGLPKTIEAYQSLQYVLNNSNIQRLMEEQNKAERKKLEISNRYGHKHPKMIAAKVELKATKNRVNKEIFKVVGSVQKDYELAVSQEREVIRIYGQIQADDRSQKGTRFNLAKLEREVDTNKELYNMLLTKLKEADLSTNKGKINIKIIDRAEVPKFAYKPNRKKIVLVAFFIGFFVGILLSFLREFNDKTFKTGESLVEITRLPLLGIFPILRKKELAGFTPERLIVERPRSSFSESVNNIRTNLMFSCGDKPPQVIMVTSAVASEGKTTVSCNLGIALARLGPTLVIEADTRRPRMRALLTKGSLDGGIFEYVAGKSTLKNSVRPDSKVKNLYTLPVKMKPEKPIEFLSSRRFSDALLILRKKFKFIVIDTPPVLPVSDAIVLASIVDGTIMVVGAESTKHDMTKDALHRLEKVNANILGTVLSRANPKTFGSYGYGYGYGHGYSYSDTAY